MADAVEHKVFDAERVDTLRELYHSGLIDFHTWSGETLKEFGYEGPGQLIEYRTDLDLSSYMPHYHGRRRLYIENGISGPMLMVEQAPGEVPVSASPSSGPGPWGRFIAWLRSIRISWH